MLKKIPKIKLLTFTSLYPNKEQPRHGIFVENRLRQLLLTGQVESKVVAPVPWFPSTNSVFGRYHKYAKVSREENRHGIEIIHPRYPVIPKLGMTFAPFFMALALLPVLKKINKKYCFDIIDAHYFYPDGVAAVIIGELLKKEVVVTARGTDINCITRYILPRSMIRWAFYKSSHVITVSKSLKENIENFCVNSNKISVFSNGVDLKIFKKPLDKINLKKKLGLPNYLILSVGNLVKSKGHDIVIKALSKLKNHYLVIIGDGEEKERLSLLSFSLQCQNRVKILNNMDQCDLAKYYGASDVLVLASDSEGCPNVIIEALSCGTPVVSTLVGNVLEIVENGHDVLIFDKNNIDSLVKILNEFPYNDQSYIRKKMNTMFSWDETVKGQIDLFCKIYSKNHHS